MVVLARSGPADWHAVSIAVFICDAAVVGDPVLLLVPNALGHHQFARNLGHVSSSERILNKMT